MAQKPIGMEQLTQVLQLQSDGISIREIARRVSISRNSVRKYLLMLNTREKTTDSELADKAYSNDLLELEAERLRQVTIHFTTAGAELLKKGATRQLWCREYLDLHLDVYAYSQYFYHLQQFLCNKDVVMHLEYKPAEQTMIDFSGKKYHYSLTETLLLQKVKGVSQGMPFIIFVIGRCRTFEALRLRLPPKRHSYIQLFTNRS